MQYQSREIYTEVVIFFWRAILGLLTIAAAFWFGDYLALTRPIPKGRPQWETIRVDQVYTILNRYNQVEWSRGNPVLEVCGMSLLPHAGHRPCWYVRTHTMNVNRIE